MDGLGSIAAVVVGVTSGGATLRAARLASASALVAGALSMAVSEYISVQSQRDAEQADVAAELKEQKRNPLAELHELAKLYMNRGVDETLAVRIKAAARRVRS